MMSTCRAIAAYLDCEFDYIPEGKKRSEIEKIFGIAVEEGNKEGYIPVLIATNEINLAEALYYNANLSIPLEDNCRLTDDERAVLREYRSQLINNLLESDSDDFLNERIAEITEYNDKFDLDKYLGGNKITFEDIRTSFYSPLKLGSDNAYEEMLLAKIPVKQPWQVAAWLPMGSWNECPQPKNMMAMAKRWYDKYGAVICCITSDEMEFRVSNPPTDSDEAYELAKEHYYFCQDRIEQYAEKYNLKTLANGLIKSKFWYFWWD